MCEGIQYAASVKFNDTYVCKKWKATFGNDTGQTGWPSRWVRYMQSAAFCVDSVILVIALSVLLVKLIR